MKRSVRLGRQKVDVNWSLIDQAINAINPEAGLRRLKHRAVMASVGGGYNGGRRDRRGTRNWRPEQRSANEDISPDLPDLRARSRDATRNIPLATGAISTVVTNVVGDGLVLQSQVDKKVLGLDDEAAEEWQQQAEREFAIWAKGADFTARLNFDQIQALAFRSVLESGDVFAARRYRDDIGCTYGLKLQLIEGDRVSNPNRGANTATLVDGVELDRDGRPVGYHISTCNPDDTTRGVKREWKQYPARSNKGVPLILHLYDQKRPDQARGVPYLAPVIEAIKELSTYAEAEVRAAVISSMFTVFVKHPTIDGDGDAAIVGDTGAGANVDPDKEVQLGSGAIVDLAEGEDVEFADPKRPNTAFEAFMTAMARQIGVALELPYELLLKSFTASYSASRAALEMAWQFFRARRSWMAWSFCQPVYEMVIAEAIARGRLAAPGFFEDEIVREAWLGSDWIGPSRIQLDPQKEASADQMDLEMGTKTRQQICVERTGGSFEQKNAQLGRESRMRKEAGVIDEKPAAGMGHNGGPPINDEETKKEEEEK